METFKPTLRESVEKIRIVRSAKALMIEPSWQRGTSEHASDLSGPPAANRHRLQMSVAITHHFAFVGT